MTTRGADDNLRGGNIDSAESTSTFKRLLQQSFPPYINRIVPPPHTEAAILTGALMYEVVWNRLTMKPNPGIDLEAGHS